MYLFDRSIQFVRGFLLSYGPQSLKQRVWDREYRRNLWQFRDHTPNDCLYRHLDRYSHHGSILDLGCGSGNTATEIENSAYSSYLGLDISRTALEKAAIRSRETGRDTKNRFAHGDFLDWQPTEQFDVILFRESMYHVPIEKVKNLLDRYSAYLKDGGVFVVRLLTTNKQTDENKYRPNAMLRIMEKEFDVVERRQYETSGHPTVLVFRPKRRAQMDKAG